MKTKPITIEDAKQIAKRTSSKGIIILQFDYEDGWRGASYGCNRHRCNQLGKVLDKIGGWLQWAIPDGFWEKDS